MWIYNMYYVCLFDCGHTVQPTALKLWHNIPHEIILNRFSSSLWVAEQPPGIKLDYLFLNLYVF